jgi:hypothetical protein
MAVNFLKKRWSKYSRKRAAGGSVRPLDSEGGETMSVIGRMDKQVEEVLIAPIARRHEQQNKEREQENREPEETTKAAEEERQGGSK